MGYDTKGPIDIHQLEYPFNSDVHAYGFPHIRDRSSQFYSYDSETDPPSRQIRSQDGSAKEDESF